MLHLRLRVPSTRTPEIVALLDDDPTVTNIAVVRDAFVSPAGCLVLADVARESATDLLRELRRRGLESEGSITLDGIETILSDAADQAEQVAPGKPDDGVVWVAVEERLRDDSRFSWAFVAFMTLAALIAGAGRILDQPILIIGAMVVGPEFSPIAALCFAAARRTPGLAPAALRALLGGFGIALVISTAFWSVAYQFDAFTRTQAATGPLTEFIIKPDGWSLLVAVLAGIAGTLSLTTSKSGPLVGVFISVTTIPAVGTMAVAASCGVWDEVGSAALQLVINIAGMVVAGTLTLLLQGEVWHRVSTRFRRQVRARR